MTTPTGLNFVDGSWTDPAGAYFDVVDPATHEIVATLPDSGPADVDAAVAAARAALATWRWTNPSVRAALLHEVGDEVAAVLEPMAQAITREMGKTIGESRGEVDKLAKAFHYYAEEATRTTGTIIPNDQDGFTSLVELEPVGVVGAISPWNYPVELIGWKLCAALAAGCTVVVKPSEYTPTCAVLLWECLERAGVPAGVANLVHGAGGAGRALASHPDLDKLAFTGSGATGAAIVRNLPSVKPLSMELGGNCPMIVTRTADLDVAVAGALRRAYRNAGQICIAINRAYVHRDHYEDFVTQLSKAVAALKVADGRDESADLGPVTNVEVLEKVERHVADAVAKGARLVVGGYRPQEHSAGNFYAPAVLADCTQEMLVMSEETFGPVLGVSVFDDLDEAIALANSTEAGLAAYGFTTDTTETFKLGRRLDFGNVAINNVDAGIMNAPYGGRKGSGYGFEHGRDGLEGYLHKKHVRIRHGA